LAHSDKRFSQHRSNLNQVDFVSLLERVSKLKTFTQIADTGKRPSSHLQSMDINGFKLGLWTRGSESLEREVGREEVGFGG
jgi:hypothetical protein